ncbi:MAG: hypothetical protein AAGD25_27635 [Cyanobacteria bacterium P01_F01_bin.150]
MANFFRDFGANADAIADTFAAYQAALGDPLNGNETGPLEEGRRQINWDGAIVPFDMPNDFFNTAPLTRGAIFSTDAGSEFRVSNPNNEADSPVDNRFSSLNSTYPEEFTTFSPNRLFTPVDTNVFDIEFYIPGTDTRATVNGYGAVFTDVDLYGETTIAYYDKYDNLLAKESVDEQPQGLAFLGATFNDADVYRVRVDLGNTPIGATDDPSNGIDVVVMDDFLYGEPQALEYKMINKGGAMVFEDAGVDAGAIAATFEAFQKALGDPLNGNDAGPLAEGRRQINWDGAIVPFEMPNNFFNSEPLTRGAVFLTDAGSQFRVSNPDNVADSALDNRFSSFNSNYPDEFTTFSPNRLFTPVGTNEFDIQFFVPGTNTPATVSGYGAVFTDVDLAGETTIDYYDQHDNLLLSESVEVQDAGLSFLGAKFEDENLFRVRVNLGTAALGANDDPTNGADVVVMDDFLYGEPQALKSTVIKRGEKRKVKGTAAPNKIKGTKDRDVLIGGGSYDVLIGKAGKDKLIGVDPKDSTPGLWERDIYRGGRDRDKLVLGSRKGYYYDDGDTTLAGEYDYAKILGLKAEDVIQLHGDRSEYNLTEMSLDGKQGIGIYLTEGQSTDELIGFAKGVSVELVDSTLKFVG